MNPSAGDTLRLSVDQIGAFLVHIVSEEEIDLARLDGAGRTTAPPQRLTISDLEHSPKSVVFRFKDAQTDQPVELGINLDAGSAVVFMRHGDGGGMIRYEGRVSKV